MKSSYKDKFPRYNSTLSHSDDKEKSIGDVLKTFNDEQMNVLNYLLYKSFSLTEEERKKIIDNKRNA